jgi:diguanylate cyclase (GGDEF)-like protein
VRVTILSNIGLCYEALGHIEEAFGYVLESLRLAESIEDRGGVAASQDKLGLLYAKSGNLEKAKQSYTHALWIKRETGDKASQADTLLMLGELQLKQEDFSSALTTFQQALKIASEIGNKPDMTQAHEKLAQVEEKQGSFQTALQHLKTVVKLKNELFDESSSRKLQSLRVTFQIEQAEKEREIYRLKNVELAQANEQLQHANEEKSDLLEQLARQAQEDALTGLYNRRYFDARMKLEFQHAQNLKIPLSLMMCDIDNFKSINDTFSHQTGDIVLSKVSELFKKGLREADVLARYGGEEFILLMPTTVLDNAVRLCDRLRQSIANYPWQEIDPKLKVTVSMGVVNDPNCSNYEKLIAKADEKLYEAKRSGKNKVCK